MKKLLLLLTILMSMVCQAQKLDSLKKNNIGIKAGPSFNLYNGSNDHGYLKMGAVAGITFSQFINQHAFWGLELLFEDRQTYNSTNYTDINGKTVIPNKYPYYELQYISLPIKIGYHSLGKFYGTGAMGLIPAIRVSSYNAYPLTIYSDQMNKIKMKGGDKFDLSVLGEIGVGYRLKDGLNLNLLGRYQIGTSKIDISGSGYRIWIHGFSIAGTISYAF